MNKSEIEQEINKAIDLIIECIKLNDIEISICLMALHEVFWGMFISQKVSEKELLDFLDYQRTLVLRIYRK